MIYYIALALLAWLLCGVAVGVLIDPLLGESLPPWFEGIE